eukprot:TRINITY_DN3703_c0_g1_i1.p1 TRINITY_DN3703_c0_g1~~TRINITY_DN3703_c0_g1_i1.p1  ORF type:complete len:50 (-),score=1.19 TRINITY_DN3703_c0_g1_i1:63-212(-)
MYIHTLFCGFFFHFIFHTSQKINPKSYEMCHAQEILFELVLCAPGVGTY